MYAPPQTPDWYWELGFPDEAACELAAEAAEAAAAAAGAAADAVAAAAAALAAAGASVAAGSAALQDNRSCGVGTSVEASGVAAAACRPEGAAASRAPLVVGKEEGGLATGLGVDQLSL